jgi:GNAT superfamily N-acetyltransferase
MAAIRPAVTAADWDAARALFRAYEAEIDAACCFEGFEAELAAIDRRYAAPEGRLLLLEDRGEPAGCAGFRMLAPGPPQGAPEVERGSAAGPELVAEGRRLYLRPSARGRGLGGALVLALLEEARAAGATTFRLETLPGKMSEAAALYRRLGFREIPPYGKRPAAGALHLELALG